MTKISCKDALKRVYGNKVYTHTHTLEIEDSSLIGTDELDHRLLDKISEEIAGLENEGGCILPLSTRAKLCYVIETDFVDTSGKTKEVESPEAIRRLEMKLKAVEELLATMLQIVKKV